MWLPIPRRPGSRRTEFDVSCDSEVQVPGHVRINGMLPSWRIESIRSVHPGFAARPLIHHGQSSARWNISSSRLNAC